MNPTRAKIIRRYAHVHEQLHNPVRASYRSLKKAVKDLRLSGKARHKLFKRLVLLTRLPLAQPIPTTAEFRMAGLVPERIALAKLRRQHPNQSHVQVALTRDYLQMLGLPADLLVYVPLA